MTIGKTMIRYILHKLYMLWGRTLVPASEKVVCNAQLALPQGSPALALPEGRESALAKKIGRIEKEANSGCGQYYELYEPRVLRALRSLRAGLCPYDLDVFDRLNHWDISDEAYEASCAAENELWNEIRSNQDCE